MSRKISLKVSGRPDSSGGYTPLVSFNNPAFAIQDQDYVGFDNNSYFFSLQTCELFTVYKLILNNVRSYSGVRESCLKIAFSIPRGYKLDNGYTPYDVLMNLKKEFVKICLTCRDSERLVYEFNSPRVDQHILDEVAASYTLSQVSSPYRCMSAELPVAYIIRPEDDIAQFFRDVNYPEFMNCSEVLIAEKVTEPSRDYTLIQHIQIPRQIKYSLMVDGVFNRFVTDVDEKLTIPCKFNPEFYKIKKLEFSVQDLLNGDWIEDVSLDAVSESITVSTRNMASPKTTVCRLVIEPEEYKEEFCNHPDYYRVLAPRRINLDNDLSFSLIGEELEWLNNQSISCKLTSGAPFQATDECMINSDGNLLLRVQKIEIPKPLIQTVPKPRKESLPIIDVKFLFKQKGGLRNGDSKVFMELRSKTERRLLKLASCWVDFGSNSKTGEFEGHFYVPRVLKSKNLVFYFCRNDVEYTSHAHVDFSNDFVELHDRDFSEVEKSFVAKNRTKIQLAIGTFLFIFVVLVSFLGGILTNRLLNNKNKTEAVEQIQNQSQNMPKSEDNIKESDTGKQKIGTFDTEQFLKEVDSKLKTKDIKFDSIHTYFEIYKKNKSLFGNDDKKIVQRIEDYERLTVAIQTKDIFTLNNMVDSFPLKKIHIWEKPHMQIVRRITDNKGEKLKSNMDSVNSFLDIERIYPSGKTKSADTTNSSKTDKRKGER